MYTCLEICADVWHCNVDEPVHRGARIKPPRLYIELNVTGVFRDTGVGRRGTAWTEDNRIQLGRPRGPPSPTGRPDPPVWDSIKRLIYDGELFVVQGAIVYPRPMAYHIIANYL